jgi:FkbM family methyltransferase
MPKKTTPFHHDSNPPWGAFKPRGINFLICLFVKLGLSHGKIKKILQLLCRKKNPIDIKYQTIKIRCVLGKNNIENKLLLSSKLREREELAILKTYLGNGGIFVDIGANIGYYSLMATTLGASRVFAFEPNETVRDRFEFNIRSNNLEKKITCIPAALGTIEGSLPLSVDSNDLGAGTLIHNGTSNETTLVKVRRLDNVLKECSVNKIDALKIDVEGYEFEALSPLLTVPSSLFPSLLIIEHAHKDLWKEDIISLLIKKGYSVIGQNRANTFLSFIQKKDQ